ncbi:MAG: Peptidase [Myxococcales bacterium]|nr:Peptidase [Myxococcales bacterium]
MKLVIFAAKRIGFVLLAATAMGAGGGDGAISSRLVGMALSDGRAFQLAQQLSDGVGPRPSGSPGAARAVAWATEQMKALGLKNVHTELVRVPRWIRGEAEAQVVTAAGNKQELHLAALGPSVPTGPDGIVADVVEVASFDELKALGDGARGKIVLFNPRTMQRGRSFEEYGRAVSFRAVGAVAAAKAGAVAALIRSAGTGAYRLPHTGAMFYDDATPKIPAAALTVEDADLIHRLARAGGRLRVRLKLTPRLDGEVDSANVIGEVPGREKKDEIVLLGAHLDSWDLGTGAVDDAAGCAIIMDAARIAGSVGRAPRRTIRVVLFMNEEMGLSGGKAYAQKHAAELSKHVAALEVDSGEGRPTGWGAIGGPAAVEMIRKLAAPLETFGASKVIEAQEAGADIGPMAGKVPMLSVEQDLTSYFDWHHTAADTADKLDPMDMALNAAAVAVMAYGLADAVETLPMSPPSKRVGRVGPPPPAATVPPAAAIPAASAPAAATPAGPAPAVVK